MKIVYTELLCMSMAHVDFAELFQYHSGMTNKREGYRNMTIQLPNVLIAALEAFAEKRRISVTEVITEDLCLARRVPLADIPPKKKSGRKRGDSKKKEK